MREGMSMCQTTPREDVVRPIREEDRHPPLRSPAPRRTGPKATDDSARHDPPDRRAGDRVECGRRVRAASGTVEGESRPAEGAAELVTLV